MAATGFSSEPRAQSSELVKMPVKNGNPHDAVHQRATMLKRMLAALYQDADQRKKKKNKQPTN